MMMMTMMTTMMMMVIIIITILSVNLTHCSDILSRKSTNQLNCMKSSGCMPACQFVMEA